MGSLPTDESNSTSEQETQQLAQTKLRSLAPQCDAVKTAYDTCFQEFFQKFISGSVPTRDPCRLKLETYQKCLRSVVESMGLDMKELDASRMDSDKIAEMLNNR